MAGTAGGRYTRKNPTATPSLHTHLRGPRRDHIPRNGVPSRGFGPPHRHAALGARHRQADGRRAAGLAGEETGGVVAPHALKLVAGGEGLVRLRLHQRFQRAGRQQAAQLKDVGGQGEAQVGSLQADVG